MAEEKNDGKILIFESPNEVIASVKYTLKVPNFFTLPEYGSIHFELEGSFELANRPWRFLFLSTEEDEIEPDDSFKSFHVDLQGFNSELVQSQMFYKIELLDADDNVYSRRLDALTSCDEDDGRFYLGTFDNKKPNYDNRKSLTLYVQLIFVECPVVGEQQALIKIDRSDTSLSRDFKNVLLSGKDHNVTFNVKGKEIRAHHDILRARSEVFCAMFNHDMLEKNSGVVDVSDCEPEAFEELILYIYTGKVEKLHENNVFGLYYCADKYNIAHLKEECRKFIKKSLSVTNVCDAVAFATKHSDDELLNSAVNYFINHKLKAAESR